MWVMRRFTICGECDRYTQTTSDRVCRKCWIKKVATMVAYLTRGVW